MKKILIALMAFALVSVSVLMIHGEGEEVSYPITEWKASQDKSTYYITTPEELMTMAQMINDGSTKFEGITFVMLNDIDMAGKAWTPAGLNSTSDNFSKAFAGTFDGNGYSVENLTVDTKVMPYCGGLFGCTDGATIKNLTMAGATVKSNGFSGGIVGYARNTIFANCVLDAGSMVTSTSRAGGIAGGMTGCTATYCINNGKIECTSTVAVYLGGISGVFYELSGQSNAVSSIGYCINNGSISGSTSKKNFIGGLVGITDSGSTDCTVNNCVNTGTLTATSGNVYVGGISGRTGNASGKNQSITDCVNSGSISVASASSDCVGGILGRLGAGGNSTTTISNCKYDNAKGYADDFGEIVAVGTSNRTLEGNGAVGEDVINAAISAVQTHIDTEKASIQKISVGEEDMVSLPLSGTSDVGSDETESTEAPSQSTDETSADITEETDEPSGMTASSSDEATNNTYVANSEETKGGCGSSVAVIAMLPFVLGIATAACAVKKED